MSILSQVSPWNTPSSSKYWAKLIHSCANEVGRLADGVGATGMPSGTNTIRLIKHTDFSASRKPTNVGGIKSRQAEH
jgi:hypothetical protein